MKIFSRRNSRFLIPLCILAFFILSDILSDSGSNYPTREMIKRINPLIYPAFIKIEIRAYEYVMRDEVNRKEYDLCKEVIAALEESARKEMKHEFYSLSAQGWYFYLQSLGFELPALYLNRQPTKDEIETAKTMQNEQESKLTEITTKYTKFILDEIHEKLDHKKSIASESKEYNNAS